jgi:two-component system, chemotaxis family, chemotaxis protein CheY
MVAGQVKSLMARHHQIGVPSMLATDAVLADAHGLVGAGVYIGDTSAAIDVVIAEFRPALSEVETCAEPPAPSLVIAEDDEVTLGFLKAVVSAAGLRLVAEARDGLQALEAIRQHRPDVVCLDINMPGLTGLQVLAKVRKALPDTIVFMVSSFATAENVREALTLRADGIIVKPFVKARIISEIERALAQRKAKQLSRSA